jgi:hypothetical protein
MSPRAPYLVVVSYYDRREAQPLRRLLDSLGDLDAGLAYDTCVVANRDTEGALGLPLAPGVRILERENSGMNIGAWDHGWRACPGYRGYLFLQYECYAVRPGWLAAFASAAQGEGVGLVGESFNTRWQHGWDDLRSMWSSHRMPGHDIQGKPANRVDVYLDFFRRNAIPPGTDGGHLRSLVWFATREVLERIGGFPIGSSYGECIAAEIGVSKRVQALGLRTVQVAAAPFHYLRHREWVLDPRSNQFVHRRLG